MLEVFFSIICVEAVTELITKSEFFRPLHKLLHSKRNNSLCKFFYYLIDCGYCTSVWVSFFVSILFIHMSLVSVYIDWFIWWMVVHRLSNVFHNCVDVTHNLINR